VAGGFSGHGFEFVPVIGEVLADLALEGKTDQPIALFDPQRVQPPAGSKHESVSDGFRRPPPG